MTVLQAISHCIKITGITHVASGYAVLGNVAVRTVNEAGRSRIILLHLDFKREMRRKKEFSSCTLQYSNFLQYGSGTPEFPRDVIFKVVQQPEFLLHQQLFRMSPIPFRSLHAMHFFYIKMHKQQVIRAVTLFVLNTFLFSGKPSLASSKTTGCMIEE
jgi:hypothetical protein